MSKILQQDDVLELRIWATDIEQASVNTFHQIVAATTGVSVTDQDVVNAYDIVFAALLKAMIYTGVTYNGMQCSVIWPLPRAVTVKSVVSAGVGTQGSIGAPRQLAGLTQYQTALAGPANRGRHYWPFMSTAGIQTPGIPSAAYQTQLSAMAAAIILQRTITVGAGSATLASYIWHRSTHTGQLITAATVSNKIATQKKRGSFGHPNSSPL